MFLFCLKFQQMRLYQSIYTDFDQFSEATLNWDLDLKLLSKNDFQSCLTLFKNEVFQLGRTSLLGKVEQKGMSPPGFRSILIPVNNNSSFYWLNRKVESNQFLFFPKDGTLDAVSHNNFDVYVISIEEVSLMNQIEMYKYLNCEKYFAGNDFRPSFSDDFLNDYHNSVNRLFRLMAGMKINSKIVNEHINELMLLLLSGLELSLDNRDQKVQRKRDFGLKKAVDFINIHIEDNVSIPYLCKYAGLSQRSLEYSFKEVYQISPKQYIKAIKLNTIKKELANNHDKLISDLAAKYGFWHMGQFAADFKNQFGKLPSETLAIGK
jgi:AraC family ethanolamine operon transcriptional activator